MKTLISLIGLLILAACAKSDNPPAPIPAAFFATYAGGQICGTVNPGKCITLDTCTTGYGFGFSPSLFSCSTTNRHSLCKTGCVGSPDGYTCPGRQYAFICPNTDGIHPYCFVYGSNGSFYSECFAN